MLSKKETLLAEHLRLVGDRAFGNDTLVKVLPLNPRCDSFRTVYLSHASSKTDLLFRHWFPSSVTLKRFPILTRVYHLVKALIS